MKTYFTDELFLGIDQVESVVEGHIMKLPMFFRDTALFSALFPAKISSLKRLLPDNRLRPARLMPGVGVISIVALQHKRTDIPDYNEVNIGIVLNNPDFVAVPGYNFLQQMLQRHSCSYVLHSPTSTDIACLGGVKGYGLAKFLSIIDFSETAEQIFCEVKEHGQQILTLSGRKIDTPYSRVMHAMQYSYQNGQPQLFEVKSVALESGMTFGPKEVELRLGDTHSIARELDDALISNRAILYLYAPRVQMVLFGPELLHPYLMKFAIEAIFPQARLAEKAERRQASREKVDIPCAIKGYARGRKRRVTAQVVDLSEGGMYVVADTALDEGTEIEIGIRPTRTGKPLNVKGKIMRNVRRGMAVRFTEEIPEDLEGVVFH